MARGDFVACSETSIGSSGGAGDRRRRASGRRRRPTSSTPTRTRSTPRGRHSGPFFKPDFSPERLRVEPYTGRLSFFRRSLLEEVGGFSASLGSAAEWDIALRVSERARDVLHVPRLLYHRRAGEAEGSDRSPSGASVRAVQAHCERIGLPARVEADPGRPGGCRLRPALVGDPDGEHRHPDLRPESGDPRRGHRARAPLPAQHPGDLDLPRLRDRLRRRRGDRPLDAGGAAGARRRAVARRRLRPAVQLLRQGQPGCGAQQRRAPPASSTTTWRCVTPDWIERLVMYSGHPGIGAVGAQLRWEDERVQHAGVVLEKGLPGHVYRGAGGELHGYARNVLVTQNYLAVTGACLMTPRDVFERGRRLPGRAAGQLQRHLLLPGGAGAGPARRLRRRHGPLPLRVLEPGHQGQRLGEVDAAGALALGDRRGPVFQSQPSLRRAPARTAASRRARCQARLSR